MNYLRIGIIVLAGIIFYVVNRVRTTSSKKTLNENNTSRFNSNEHSTTENMFESLRNKALSITPDQLGLSLSNDGSIVYGVIMDWGIDGSIATIVTYQTGDASLYLSSGGGVIGGGQHQTVNSVSKEFVSLAQRYFDNTAKTESTPLPSTDEVKFYLLTNKGIYTGSEIMKNFKNSSSVWLPLFEKGNDVLSELRKMSEKQ